MRRQRKAKGKPATAVGPHRRRKLTLRPPWLKQPNWTLIRRVVIAALWLAMGGIVFFGWSHSVPLLQAFASANRSADRNDVVVRFVNAPAWMRGDLADLLLRTAQANIEGDPMVRDDLIAVRRSLVATGWFEAVDQVRRTKEDEIEITARFVTPFAVIRDHAGDHLVDAEGTLLPKSYERGAMTNFVVISGAHFERPRRPGVAWEGADVVAGLKLLDLIQQQTWKDQVEQIDVSEYLGDGPLKVRTDRGCTIIWGGGPGVPISRPPETT
ncbi:MAG: hypothetical protein L0Y42_11120 [Phycisphaerales bacterium]|nr:hypothetical protein [Phycisphaerales bacterium]